MTASTRTTRTTRLSRCAPRRQAFTLVEILVSIAVLALLLGALLPTLSGARRSARTAICAAQTRALQTGAQDWATRNRETLPGLNTSNRKYLSAQAARDLLGDTSPTTPTSVWDWISPSMGDSLPFSTNRARRTHDIFTRLRCPEAHAHNDSLYGPVSVEDFQDFQAILQEEGFPQISYLSPASFHLFGKRPGRNPWHGQSNGTGGWTYPYTGPAETPRGYKPMLSMVGAASRKVFVADGTRYLASQNLLDFDVNPIPTFYGSFTSSGPIYMGSTAYGQNPQDVEFLGNGERPLPRSVYPHNADLSYRHRGAINAAFFDGHVELIDEAGSKKDASRWYPSGSVFTGRRATAASREFHAENERLH